MKETTPPGCPTASCPPLAVRHHLRSRVRHRLHRRLRRRRLLPPPPSLSATSPGRARSVSPVPSPPPPPRAATSAARRAPSTAAAATAPPSAAPPRRPPPHDRERHVARRRPPPGAADVASTAALSALRRRPPPRLPAGKYPKKRNIVEFGSFRVYYGTVPERKCLSPVLVAPDPPRSAFPSGHAAGSVEVLMVGAADTGKGAAAEGARQTKSTRTAKPPTERDQVVAALIRLGNRKPGLELAI
nr:uncharacterized protein LOC127328402 [Lolium perenne]